MLSRLSAFAQCAEARHGRSARPAPHGATANSAGVPGGRSQMEIEQVVTVTTADRPARKNRNYPHGLFEKLPGSRVWWIRYADSMGRIRREKAGTKGAAIDLYRKRKNEALQGKKLPESLRKPAVSFAELAQDALLFSKTHTRTP